MAHKASPNDFELGRIRLMRRVEDFIYRNNLAVPLSLATLKVLSVGRPRSQQSYRYKRLILQIMRRVLASDSCAIDIGSHRGLFLSSMLKYAPKGRHMAIEPIPQFAEQLRVRFPQVEVQAVAAGDRDGLTPFYFDQKESGYSSLMQWDNRAGGHHTKVIQVPIAQLDSLVPEQRAIRFIKMDAMGAHVEIFRGAARVIKRDKPFIVFYARNPIGGDAPKRLAELTWQLVVEEYGMRISRLQDWETNALSEEQFMSSVGHHAGSEFCFIAQR